MKAALALALACLLFANGVLGAGGLLNRYQPPRQGRRLSTLSRHSGVDAYKPSSGRKMLALIPGLSSSGSGAPGSAAGSGSNKTSSTTGASGSSSKNATADLVLTTTVAYGDSVVACKEWQPDTLTWEWPSKPTEYTAAGKAQPPAANVKKMTDLICSDPEAAGKQILTAVQAGGSQAQTAVYAIFAADCDDENAASDAYSAAIDAVNDGDAAKIDAVSSWLSNFAAAADEVGVPVCMSLAVVDMATDEAVETRDFHATGPAPSASKGSSKGSSKGASKGTTSSSSTGGPSGSSSATKGSSSGSASKGSTGGR